MEHLPTPKNARTDERVVVPYVCLKDYDGGPFLTNLIREGVKHALPLDGSIPGGSPYRRHELTCPTPKQEQEDFLQRWLFFGLIHEIIGDRYKPANLTHTIESDGGEIKMVISSGLVETLDKWIPDIKSGCKPCHTYEHIAECLRLSFATIRGTSPGFDPRIKLSLALLGELFTLAANEAYGAMHSKCPQIFSIFIARDHWESNMVSSGWCPSQIKANFDGNMYLQILHFFALLGQPTSTDFHRSCNDNQCLANQNDLATYQPKHVTGCSCETLLIDTQRLIEILECGSLPLLRIQKGHTPNELFVELVPASSTSQYIALSHVWADGLGNPHENALPRCQLDFLHQIIHKILCRYDFFSSSRRDFTVVRVLCYPVKPGRAKDLALAQMKKIYLEAFRVLVLDASLRIYDSKKIGAVEACIRIFTSGWTRRLWTLQEGALGAKDFRLAFLVRDGPINMHFLVHQVSETSKLNIGRKGLVTNVLYKIGNFASASHEIDENERADIGTVGAGLQHRSVSVPSDEPLLVANLLNLDVFEILNGSCPLTNCANVGCSHSRIPRLWRLMPTAFQSIPRSIFHRVGPRLSEPGFRWAPSKLLFLEPQNALLLPRVRNKNEGTFTATSESNSSLPSDRLSISPRRRPSSITEGAAYAIPTSRGLLVRFTGYSFSKACCSPGVTPNTWNTLDQGSGLHCRGVDGKWYILDRRLPAERDSFLSPKSLRTIIEEAGNLWITHEESAFGSPALTAETKDELKTTVGLLVQLQSDEEDIKYVRSKLHILIGLLERNQQVLCEAAYKTARDIAEDLSSTQLAGDHRGPQKGPDDSNPSKNTLGLETLEQEIKRVTMQNAIPDVAAAIAALSRNGIALFQETIAMVLMGEYGYLGARTAEEQEWCFD